MAAKITGADELRRRIQELESAAADQRRQLALRTLDLGNQQRRFFKALALGLVIRRFVTGANAGWVVGTLALLKTIRSTLAQRPRGNRRRAALFSVLRGVKAAPRR